MKNTWERWKRNRARTKALEKRIKLRKMERVTVPRSHKALKLLEGLEMKSPQEIKRTGKYFSALEDKLIEFASVSKMIRQAKKHSVKKGGIFVDNAPISGSTGHLRGKKYGYKKGTANKSEWLARGAYRTPRGARGAQARYKIKSSLERANRG